MSNGPKVRPRGLVMAQTYLAVRMCSVCALRPCFRAVLFLPLGSRGQIQWGR